MGRLSFITGAAALFAGLAAFPGSVLASSIPIPGVTGWNADVIYSNGETNPAAGTGEDNSGHDFVSQNVTGVGTAGLPTNGAVTITSTGDSFQFQSYTGNNAAKWVPNGTATTGATLTLGTPAAYSKLSILAASGNNAGKLTGDIIVNFVGGTTQTFAGALALTDWVTAGGQPANAPLTAMHYYDTQVETGLNVGLVETTISVTGTLPIASVTFQNGGSSGVDDVMALSGVALPEPATIGLFSIAGLGLLARRRRCA